MLTRHFCIHYIYCLCHDMFYNCIWSNKDLKEILNFAAMTTHSLDCIQTTPTTIASPPRRRYSLSLPSTTKVAWQDISMENAHHPTQNFPKIRVRRTAAKTQGVLPTLSSSLVEQRSTKHATVAKCITILFLGTRAFLTCWNVVEMWKVVSAWKRCRTHLIHT